MKSTIFTKIIDEETIEVNESFAVTIERLKQQQGVCRETDSRQIPLEFFCHDDGRVCVCNYSRHRLRREYNRLYSVVGEVISEEGKTKVIIYSLYSRINFIFFIIAAVLFLPSILIYVLFAYTADAVPSAMTLYAITFGIASIVLFPWNHTRQIKNKNSDLEIMKNEIIKRVKAVDKWDD